MKMLPAMLLLLLFVPASGGAQRYVSGATHRFFDRRNLLAFGLETAANALDQVQTCRNLHHGGVEVSLPAQSCGGVLGFKVAFQAGYMGGSYLLHRLGHHRLERIPPYIDTAGAINGWQYSFRHRNDGRN